MFTENEYKLDRIEIANNILVRLEMEYKYAVNKNVDKAEMVKFLAEQLDRLSDMTVLSWNEALNTISDKAEKHPPTIPEIIDEMRRIEIATRPPLVRLEKKEIPFELVWNKNTEEERLQDTMGWIKYCPRDMPTVMLDWARQQEGQIKTRLLNMEKKAGRGKNLLA
jgi:hypothetical protein